MCNAGFRSLFSALLLCFFSLWMAASRTDAAETAPAKIADQQLEQLQTIQKKYRSLTSLSFDFTQTVQSNGRKRHGAGSSVFYRPAKGSSGVMRWNYAEPAAQVIVNDGKKLSIYTQKDKQVIVASAKDMQSDITYSFFAGSSSLLDDFSVLPADSHFAADAGKQKGALAVQLVPKKAHGQIKTVHLWFDGQSMISKLIMEDHFDTLTELAFANVKFDALPANSAKTAEELVRLDLPPGVEVIKQ